MKRLPKTAAALLLTIATCFSMVAPVVADGFNQNRIIDDSVFDNTGTMNAQQIDSFLNSFPNSCVSPNSGFKAIDPTGYNPTSGFQYGGYVTAGQVIYDASQAYGINPQVLLTTLQKEQSLVVGGTNFCENGDLNKYAAAVGYGCPDGGTSYSYSGLNLYQRNGVTVSSVGSTCVDTAAKAGFSQQIIRAAWLFKFGEHRSEGDISWAVIKGNWNNSDDPQSCYGGPMTQGTWQRCPSSSTTYYDGYTTIDNTSVHMDTGATAALYWYTPHFSGNQNFYDIFYGWFGNTIGPDYNGYVTNQDVFTDSGYTSPLGTLDGRYYLAPGQKVYVRIKEYNNGRATWNNSNTRLGTYQPLDYSSAFADSSWMAKNRIVSMQESSVAPGQTATFTFSMTAPNYAANFIENYSIIVEQVAWINTAKITLPITVTPKLVPGTSQNTLTTNQVFTKGSTLFSPEKNSVLKFQNNGNLELYVNFKKVWQSGTVGSGANNLVLQTDGNLVLYSPSGAVWGSGTSSSGANNLVLQTDGNLVLYSPSGAVWGSGTSTIDQTTVVDQLLPANGALFPDQPMVSVDRRYTMVLQNDGNLVLYSPNRALWGSGTYGQKPGSLIMQNDGNLVLYNSDGWPIWSSRTYGNSNSVGVVQADGNSVLYSPLRAIWSTGTQGQQ